MKKSNNYWTASYFSGLGTKYLEFLVDDPKKYKTREDAANAMKKKGIKKEEYFIDFTGSEKKKYETLRNTNKKSARKRWSS